MKENRRSFLKLGATSAAAGMLGQAALAAAQEPQIAAISPLAAKLGLRLATFSPRKEDKPRVGVVLDDDLNEVERL